MKYLFSLSVPLLLLALVVTTNSQESDSVYAFDYATLSEFVEDCEGKNALGATCEAKCPSQGCACQTNIFRCNCYCVGGGSPGGPDEASISNPVKNLTLPAEDVWVKVLAVIESEDTELARDLYDSVVKLRGLGERNLIEEYDALAVELDKKFMELKPATLEKFLNEFQG